MKTKGYANLGGRGGQIRCIMGDVQVANTAQNTVYKSRGTTLVFAADATLQQALSFFPTPVAFLTPFDHCFVFHLVVTTQKPQALGNYFCRKYSREFSLEFSS